MRQVKGILITKYPPDHQFTIYEVKKMITEVTTELYFRPKVYEKKIANPRDKMDADQAALKITLMEMTKILLLQKLKELQERGGIQQKLF